MSPRDQILAKARFYADECSEIMKQVDGENGGKGAAAARASRLRRDHRMAAAGMMNAQALGLLMAVKILDQEPTP